MRSAGWIGIGAVIAGAMVAAAAIAVGIADARWDRATERAVSRLDASAALYPAAAFDPAQLATLPAPVARYFRFALAPGQRMPRRARIEQSGEFLLAPGRWSRFVATSHVAAAPPAFVWDASIRVAPLVPVRVRDGYDAGEGRMLGRVLALARVVDQHGTPEMAEASLQRWLAEGVWLPTALLPRHGVTWSPIDENTARATIVDGAVRASVDFQFGASGEVTGTSATRFRDVRGTPVRQRWVGSFRRWTRLDGMMVPLEGEVAWEPTDGAREAYWRGTIDRLTSW